MPQSGRDDIAGHRLRAHGRRGSGLLERLAAYFAASGRAGEDSRARGRSLIRAPPGRLTAFAPLRVLRFGPERFKLFPERPSCRARSPQKARLHVLETAGEFALRRPHGRFGS